MAFVHFLASLSITGPADIDITFNNAELAGVLYNY